MNFRNAAAGYRRFIVETEKKYRVDILVLISLFVIGLVLGFLRDKESPLIRGMIEGLFQEFSEVRGIQFTVQLFFHNVLASVTSLTGIVFSIFPIVSALLNGFIIGHTSFLLEGLSGLSTTRFVLMILPHGVFEIPAFLVSMALGFRLGTWPFRRNRIAFLKNTLKDYLTIFYKFIFPMLLVAAIIESISAELLFRWAGR